MLQRRCLIANGLASLMGLPAAPRGRYRAVVIGDARRGGYGHGWDTAWNGIPGVEVIAVADPDERGRSEALKRTGANRSYADYRDMLAREKPDLAVIGPRTLDQRLEMFTAVAEAKAHILLEKPFAASIDDAGRMLRLATSRGVKVQVGHTARVAAVVSRAREMAAAGELGDLLEIRSRGKEDRRAGGEDLIVLGTHNFDLMRYLAGDPAWVFADVTEGAAELKPEQMRDATEPVGKVGGTTISAIFGFGKGIHGYFGSKRSSDIAGRRFGVTVYGTRGMLFIPLTQVPNSAPYLLRSPAWAPERGEAWERLEYPPEARLVSREDINRAMALDLIDAIERDREPLCSARDGWWTIQMTSGVYRSHFSQAKVSLPLRFD